MSFVLELRFHLIMQLIIDTFKLQYAILNRYKHVQSFVNERIDELRSEKKKKTK